MIPDAQLLRRYMERDDQTAFAELVERYLDMVYSAALRQVNGDSHLAEEVAQSVLTDLARKAKSLAQRDSLTGWLYTSTHFAAAKAVRSRQRRLEHEQRARVMIDAHTYPDPPSDWEALRPALDQAMHELKASDRELILLRFFQNRHFAAIGETLGLSEDTARKRVDRALIKLREVLTARGITSASALAGMLENCAAQTAPAGLAAKITGAALAAAGTHSALLFLNFLAMTKLQLALTTVIIATAAATWVAHVNRESRLLREQIAQLQAEKAELSDRLSKPSLLRIPSRPAPRMHFTPALPGPVEPAASNNLSDSFPSLKAKAPNTLTSAQLADFLARNGRNAASLLAAYRTSLDPALLKEAMEKFSTDPQVALAASLRKDASPSERAEWLENFKRSDPNNALPNYLAALNQFQAGQTDQAIQELIAATSKHNFQDYSVEHARENEQAYLSAGYSAGEAKALEPLLQAIHFTEGEESAAAFAPMDESTYVQIKALSVSLRALAESYQKAGDPASARAVLEMGVALGQRYSQANSLDGLSQRVGIAAEVISLSAMDAAASLGDQTAQARLDELKQRRQAVKSLYIDTAPLLGNLSDQDWEHYSALARAFGEPAALQWVAGKYGGK